MEREQELHKLINVLRRIAHLATRAQEMGAGESEARYVISLFNKILARLGELDPNIKNVFGPLAEESSLLSVAMACRQVVSYYEDEVKVEEEFRVGWKVDEESRLGWFATDFGKKGFLRVLAGFKSDGAGYNPEELDNWMRDVEREWGGREHKHEG